MTRTINVLKFYLCMLAILFVVISQVYIAVAEEPETLSSTDEMRVVSGALGDRESLPGAALYARHCMACHAGQVYKAPHTSWLEMMPARTIYTTMTEGLMQVQAAELSDAEKRHVVEYLLQEPFSDEQVALPALNYCTGADAQSTAFNANELTGWGARYKSLCARRGCGLSCCRYTSAKNEVEFRFSQCGACSLAACCRHG